MSEIIERLSVGFDAAGVAALAKIRKATHLTSNGDIARGSLRVMHDLITAEERGYVIILRSASGAEWSYSPHRPEHALPLTTGTTDANVVAGPFIDRMIAVAKERAGLKSARKAKAAAGADKG
jgi:hypothetical protein